MKEIFINLKRFDVPRALGGVCDIENSKVWIEEIIEKSVALGLGKLKDMMVVYMLPEAYVLLANEKLAAYPIEERKTLAIGVQGVYRNDVEKGVNFGA
jgi:triosephosphate isomerase